MIRKKKQFPKTVRGEGFLEMALVLVLVAIVLIAVLALLGPEISAWIEGILE